ncbi:VOC family protein [Micromonospora sp. CNB394]|uniref:VOC family protein n=1 Tax=Micromonospora sp. CNB394 TaxID=1169151 RepID=UPI0003822AB9|nr:VOC family protein [Micromonospora sp. CNB394]
MSGATPVNLPVRDLDAAVAFFAALGFVLAFPRPGARPPGARSAQLGLGATTHLLLHLPPPSPRSPHQWSFLHRTD